MGPERSDQMTVRIGLLTYDHLHALAFQALDYVDDPDIELCFIEGLMGEIVDTVKRYYRENKVEMFLGGGANGTFIKEHADVPVKIIDIGLFEILTAVAKARRLGERIGIATYKDARCYADVLRESLNMDIVKVSFADEEELSRGLQTSGVDVVVGASLANRLAEKAGLPSVLVYPGPESIAAAIKDAKVMALEIRSEKERRMIFQAVLDYSWGGIVATDSGGRVIAYNPVAEKLLAKPRSDVIGKPMSGALPDIGDTELTSSLKPQIGHLRELNGTKVVVNRIPIVVSDDAVGSVTTFQKVSELQKAEGRIRTKLADKGLSARTRFDDIVAVDDNMRVAVAHARLFADSGLSVYIFGETGVGKEMFAQGIHNESSYRDGPFVAVNCAALPESLLESELFGYEEGAFTGSRKGGKMGLFELAHRGTIFLDEVAEIPLHIQARLLRVLQEKEVMRLGGDRVIPIDVRVISASNRHLRDGVAAGVFREDLFYRLNVLHVEIPPLRERHDDIAKLFFHFLSDRHPDLSECLLPLRATIVEIICRYSWPGNARELQNVIERISVLLRTGADCTEHECRMAVLEAIGKDVFIRDFAAQTTADGQRADKNGAVVQELCKIFRGDTERVARQLGVSRTTLWRRTTDLADAERPFGKRSRRL